MAFNQEYLLPLSSMGNSNVPRHFEYLSSDTLATIITDDYFLSTYQALDAGDIIICFAGSSKSPVNLVVTAATSSTVTVEVLGGAEDLTAVGSITADDSGRTFFLNSATEFATTLPAPVKGLRYKFIVKAAPSGASYTIVTASSANIIIGGINELEVDTGDDGPYIDDGDTITFVDGVSVVGDYVDLISDGTSWYVSGQAKADGGITLTQAS